MANYDGLTRNAWPGTWSPSADHPIVLDTEVRGGLRYISGASGDQLSDIKGQRLQEGMLVYVDSSFTSTGGTSYTGGKYYRYQLLQGESRNLATGVMPNADGNWVEFVLSSSDPASISSIVDSAYVQARQTDFFRDSAFVTGIVDQVYIQSLDRVRDSSFILDLTEPEYISATSNDVKTGNLTFEDDTLLEFGTNQNLSIQYFTQDNAGLISQDDGGELKIVANTLNLQNLNGETYLNAISNGGINLKYDNNTKLKVEDHGITVVGDVVPFYDSTYSLGTASKKWKELWVSSNTIFVGGLSISAQETGLGLKTIDSDGNEVASLGVIDPKNLDNAINLDLDSTSQQLIDSFNKLEQRTARYIIQIGNDSSNKYHSTEILLMHNNTNVYMTEYAVLRTDSSLGEITADITGDTVRLLITPSYDNTSIKAKRLIIDA